MCIHLLIQRVADGVWTRFQQLNRLITAVKLKPVVNKVFAFEDVRQAFEYQDSQQHIGKVVIRVSKE